MKTFRGYVSKAQEGILSENPEAREYDSTPTPGEARDRARANTLAWSLREEDMGAVGDMLDIRATRDTGATAEKGKALGCATDPGVSTDHKPSVDGSSGSIAGMPTIPDMPTMPAMSTDGMVCDKPGGWRLFSTRALLIALVVNLCLVAAFLVLLRLERGSGEVVFYIDLADQPAKIEANGANAGDAAGGHEAAPLLEGRAADSVPDAAQEEPAADGR